MQVLDSKVMKQRIKQGYILFGTNFEDTADMILQKWIQKGFQNSIFSWKSPFDLLQYLDKDIFGCSTPQIYFKVHGVYTALHQEYVAMCSVNINHGPGSS